MTTDTPLDDYAGHTPGPWVMWTSNSFRRIHGGDGVPVCEPVKQSDGHPDLHFPNRGYHGPDARLMVDAPTILERARTLERELAECRAALAEISAAIGTNWYMNPPDGGSVTLAEQVRRMSAALALRHAAIDELVVALDLCAGRIASWFQSMDEQEIADSFGGMNAALIAAHAALATHSPQRRTQGKEVKPVLTDEQIKRLGVLAYDMVDWSERGRGQYLPSALRDYVQTLLATKDKEPQS